MFYQFNIDGYFDNNNNEFACYETINCNILFIHSDSYSFTLFIYSRINAPTYKYVTFAI